MTITEEQLEQLKECIDYVWVDGSHHKQYALVEIGKIILGKKAFAKAYRGVDEGIPD
jgi:hypothetical protein